MISFCLNDLYSGWAVGALDLFREQVLPQLLEVEQLEICCAPEDAFPEQQQAEVCRFFGSLITLEKLKHLHFDYEFPTGQTVNALLAYVKNCEVIENFEADNSDRLNDAREIVEHYINLNCYGRRHLRNSDIPVGAWPHVLASTAEDQDNGIMFEFFKTLNESVDLFRYSGLQGSRRREAEAAQQPQPVSSCIIL